MYDILIIGAGPAGANLARMLGEDKQNKFSIGLLDKRRLDLPSDPLRQKACGGLLSPDAQKILGELGLTLPASVLEDPQLFKVRTIDFDAGKERSYQRYYYNMNREKFDRYLYALIPDYVDKKCGAVVTGIFAMSEHWEVVYKQGDKKHVVQAKFLVAADGANSYTRRVLLPNHKRPDLYISVQKWYPLFGVLPYFTGIFDTEVTDYYSWTIPKGDFLILGTAIPYGENVAERFTILEQKVSRYLNLKISEPVKTEGAFIERTAKQSALCFASLIQTDFGTQLPLALIGEAAGATSPTSAEGFSYAFSTSKALSKAMSYGVDGAELRYEKLCTPIRLSIVKKNLKRPAMYWPKLRKLVMASGMTAMKDPMNTNAKKRSYDLT